MLTWPQTAVKVVDDHNETSQTQGKNHHFGCPHPEPLETTEKPNRIPPGFMRQIVT